MYKIVIAEDDIALLNMYKIKLSSAGFHIITASNGAQAFSTIKRELPDLVLLDIKMPEMSGDDVLEKMRATDWGCAIRVIILTNISKDEAPMKLRFLNVDRYVVKAHHTPSQILEIVREIIPLGRLG